MPVFQVESIRGLGVIGRGVLIADVLANDRAVVGFQQFVVDASPGPRLGLLYQWFVQNLGHGGVDKLATVVGMKAPDRERRLLQHRLEHRYLRGF